MQSMKLFSYSLSLLAVLLLFGCKNGEQNRSNKKTYTKKELQDYNRLMAKKEAERIDQFVEAKNWPCTETGTGLNYWIYEKGEGALALPGQRVSVNLVIMFLNGDTAYSYTRYGSEEFLIDRTNLESGLNEGVQYMNLGSKAKLVVPSHLAHGLVGDAKRIPPRTPLVFDVELLAIKN